NTFYHHGSGAIQVVSNQAGIDHADHNVIVHNTFFHNGHEQDYAGFQGGIYFSSWSGQSPVGNVIKNNLFHDNAGGSVSYDGTVDPQTIEGNWCRSRAPASMRPVRSPRSPAPTARARPFRWRAPQPSWTAGASSSPTRSSSKARPRRSPWRRWTTTPRR
ncbi:MAG: right-handed parallel beta-helix repeat-containing protein, partial [Deltaproteobacteria bacterium]|nr:right-handed parallel beta-helix repeat-containing protein [Deltaproteobacteria bacterium]